MRRRVSAAAVLCALALAATAAGHGKSIPSTILPLGSSGTNPDFSYAGDVTSPKRKCISGRTVDLIGTFGTDTRVIDTDRTSQNGAWVVGGDDASASNLIVKVDRKRIGRRHHHRVCAAAHNGIAF